MLIINIPANNDLWDERNEIFITTKEVKAVTLEHSLVSLSKWESKWHKPFFTKGEKTNIESLDYIRCMTITPSDIDPLCYLGIPSHTIDTIHKYIEDSMTATTFSKDEHKVTNREIVTAEIIYYYMITLNIPFECQKWHLNRLLTLINVCNLKNQKPKALSQSETIARNRALNAERKARLNTKG